MSAAPSELVTLRRGPPPRSSSPSTAKR
jgi:hypothetical protein